MHKEQITRVVDGHPTDKNAVTETHPSFGMINLVKYTNNPGDYKFGSSVKSFGGICLEVHSASRRRSLSHDWIHPDNIKIRVNMTHQQFVDLITTGMNTSGVPCTIAYDETHGSIAQPEDSDKSLREKILNDFEKAMRGYTEEIKNAQNLLKLALDKKGGITKTELKEIDRAINSSKSALDSHLPFIAKSFNEDMDKIASHVKAEVLHSEVVRDMLSKGSDLQLTDGGDHA